MISKYLITGGEGFIGSKIVEKVGGYSFDLKSGQDIFNKDKRAIPIKDLTVDCIYDSLEKAVKNKNCFSNMVFFRINWKAKR